MRSSKSKNRKVKFLVFLGLKCRRKIRKRRKKHQCSRRRLVTFPWVLRVNKISSRVFHLFKAALHPLGKASRWANQRPQDQLLEVVADHLEDSRWAPRQVAFLQWDPCPNSHKWKSRWYSSKIALTMSSIRGCQISIQAYLELSEKTKLQVTSKCQQTSSKRYPTKHIAAISVLRFSRRSTLTLWILARSRNTKRPKDNWMRSSHFWRTISWLKILAR